MFKYLLVFLGLSVGLSAVAAASLSVKEEYIQKELRDLCSYQDKIIFTGHFYNKAVESTRKELELALTTFNSRFVKNRGETAVQTQYMHDVINSDVFISEMRTCFPNESERNRVVFLSLWADVAGQFTGVAQVGVTFWGAFKLVKFLGKSLFLSFSKVMTKMNGLAPKITQEQFVSYFSWAATIFPVGYAVVDHFRGQQEPSFVAIEKVQLELNNIEQQVELVLSKTRAMAYKEGNFCVYNDLAFNLGQDYFSILRDMKSKGVDLKVFGDNRHFRFRVGTLKLCKNMIDTPSY